MLVQAWWNPFDVHLVHDGPLPRDRWLALRPQVNAGSITRHFSIKSALSRSVERQILVGGVEHVAEQPGPR